MTVDKVENEHPPDDRKFIEQVYSDFSRLMYYTVRKYLSDPDQQEDVVQDSLTKLIAKVDTLKTLNQSTLAGYVVVTVRNTAISYLKSQGAENNKVLSLENMGENMMQDSYVPLDERLVLEEQIQEMRNIWPQLDEKTKRILEGKYILDYSDQQLAKLLGCKPSSVRMKLTRARRKVLSMLKERNAT